MGEDLFPSATPEELRMRKPEYLRTKAGIRNFLEKSVFYPAAGHDLEVIDYLRRKGFSNFIYVDSGLREVSIGVFFGKAWDGYELSSEVSRCCLSSLLGRIDSNVDRPVTFCAKFKKVSKVKGPEEIHVIYIKSEAVSIFRRLFEKWEILPDVCAYSSNKFKQGPAYLRKIFNGDSSLSGFFVVDGDQPPWFDLNANYASNVAMGRWRYYSQRIL